MKLRPHGIGTRNPRLHSTLPPWGYKCFSWDSWRGKRYI